MGKYDQFLVGLSSATPSSNSGAGKYAQFTAGLDGGESVLDAVKKGYRAALSRPELTPYGAGSGVDTTDPIEMARETVTAPIRAGATLNSAPDVLGQALTEGFSEAGYPKTGIALGFGTQMAPYVLPAALGMRGLYRSTNPSIKGALNTTKELGKEFSAQNDAIGVTRRVPPEGGLKARFAEFERTAATKQPKPVVPAEPVPSNIPVRYPGKPGDFMAYANGRLSSQKPIAPQELMDWQVKLQTDMSNGTIPKIDPTTGRTTTIFQQATELLDRTKSAFNSAAETKLKGVKLPAGVSPTRAGLNKAFSQAAGREALGPSVKKYAGRAAKGVGTIIGGASLWNWLRNQ